MNATPNLQLHCCCCCCCRVPVAGRPLPPIPSVPSAPISSTTPLPAVGTPIGTPPSAPVLEIPKPLPSFPGPSKIVAAYFTNWSIYGRNFSLSQVDGRHVSHILYAFFDARSDGSIALTDRWADTDKIWGMDDNDNLTIEGNFRQMAQLKAKFPHLKVLASIGGWTLSRNFSDIARDASKTKFFASAAAHLVSTYGFDGIDIDWEYPGSEGGEGTRKDTLDPQRFVLLLQALRTALDKAAEEDSAPEDYMGARHYSLTAALPGGAEKYSVLPIREIVQELDIAFIMTYDNAGMGWSNTTDHQSSGLWVSSVIGDYVNAGALPQKLCIGSPLYGRVFSGTQGLHQPFVNNYIREEGEWEQAIWDIKMLPRPGASVQYDAKQYANYSYDASKHEFITFDHEEALAYKLDLSMEHQLGGVFFWELSADYPATEKSLVRFAHSHYTSSGFHLPDQRGCLKYKNSSYKNIQNMSTK